MEPNEELKAKGWMPTAYTKYFHCVPDSGAAGWAPQLTICPSPVALCTV